MSLSPWVSRGKCSSMWARSAWSLQLVPRSVGVGRTGLPRTRSQSASQGRGDKRRSWRGRAYWLDSDSNEERSLLKRWNEVIRFHLEEITAAAVWRLYWRREEQEAGCCWCNPGEGKWASPVWGDLANGQREKQVSHCPEVISETHPSPWWIL